MIKNLKQPMIFFIFSLVASVVSCTSDSNDNPPTSTKFALPEGTRIYVSDVPNFDKAPWQIIVYDNKGENGQVFTDEELDWPQDLVFLEDRGEVLIANLTSGKINRHNSATGDYIDTFADDIGGPTRMKIGPDGLLYVLQWTGSGKVLRYDLDSGEKYEFTDTGIPQSIGLDWDSSGKLYVSSFQNNQVIKFNHEGHSEGVFIGGDPTKGPTNIWFDTSDNLMVNDWKGGTIIKFNSAGELVETVAEGLSQIEGVSVLSDGSFLIGNGGTGAVKLFDAEGNFVEDFVAAKSGGLSKPNAVILRNAN